MQKRGQAATEFMMTYGWAIMMVIIVFGVVYYYVDFRGSNTCKIDAPFVCGDVKAAISSGNSARLEIDFSIEGNEVADVSNLVVTSDKGNCYDLPNGVAAAYTTQKNLLKDSDQSKQVISAYCGNSNFKKGDSVQGTIEITYQRQGKLEHIAYGSYYAGIE